MGPGMAAPEKPIRNELRKIAGKEFMVQSPK